MHKYAIVVIGYNRTDSISRLLSSLNQVEYFNDQVDLIISIDNSGSDEVENCAKLFEWKYGYKTIKTYPERLGLRQHILICGDFVEEYDAIAVFEDDILVSPAFYNYMRQAVPFYEDDHNIAGISLYSHLWAEGVGRPFTPEKAMYDTYFLQHAQSWGQIWMKKQWLVFKEWYKSNNGEIKEDIKTPSHIIDWPKSSWLKYHIKYCIDLNKYFVYPYFSYTTNFVDFGQHCKVKTTVYQVPMDYRNTSNINFSEFGNAGTPCYDVFFERQFIGEKLGVQDEDLHINLYGGKPDDVSKRYFLTSKPKNYKILKSFALELRPHEMNVIFEIPGKDIFLYDRTIKVQNNFLNDEDLTRWYYDSRIFDYKYIVRTLLKIIKKRILKK